MGGRSRVAGQRLGVAQVQQSGDELQRVVKADGGFVAALDVQRHQRAALPIEVLRRQRVVGTVGKAAVRPGIRTYTRSRFGARDLRYFEGN